MANHHGERSTCLRCGCPGAISAGFGSGALCDTGDMVTCWDGRECSLRLKRKRRRAA